MSGSDHCCGFGGSFAVKFPEVSNAILGQKLANAQAGGAQVVVANDAGCILHMRGGAERAAPGLKVMHLAEILAAD
jgi:L-lactate dehydrogenase complex protein LldE